MTREELDEVKDIKKELLDAEIKIRKLECRIEKLEKMPAVTDVVKGSDSNFPFTVHTMLIHGLEKSDQKTTLSLKMELLRQKQRQEKLVDEFLVKIQNIEMFVSQIPKSRDRMIFDKYYNGDMSYREIAEELNISEKTVQRRMTFILENLESVR